MSTVTERVRTELVSTETAVILVCVAVAIIALFGLPALLPSDVPRMGDTVFVFLGVGVPAWYRNYWAERYPDPLPAAAWAVVASLATACALVGSTLTFSVLLPWGGRIPLLAGFVFTVLLAVVVRVA